MAIAEHNHAAPDPHEAQWPELRRRTARRIRRRNLRSLWPEPCGNGMALRWGIATACGAISPTIKALSQIAGGGTAPAGTDLTGAAERLIERLGKASLKKETLVEAVAWGYAIPELAMDAELDFSEDLWWDLLSELQATQRAAIGFSEHAAIERLLAGGELGAVLAWRMADLPSCAAMREPASEAVTQWFAASGDAVTDAISDAARWSRVALASALRCRRLLARNDRRISIKRSGAAVDLAAWIAAMSRTNGSAALSDLTITAEADVGDDGLMAMAAKEIGGPALRTAVEASLGKTHSDGRLAWKVELPEPGWFDEDAAIAVMLPEWDVRRGRVAIHFSGANMRLEVSGGKRPLLVGDWTVRLRLEGRILPATSGWTDVCWYSDDDVHYLELEQNFASGVKVQRQVMLLRDDRCLMLADAVIGGPPGQKLEYHSAVPLAPSAHIEEDRETRELLVVDGKTRGVIMPLSLNEWRTGPSAGTFRAIDAEPAEPNPPSGDAVDGGNAVDGGDPRRRGLILATDVTGPDALYCPLWIDLDRKRIREQRTWRRLTVGQSLRLVPHNEAAAFRIQSGVDQWLVYRSLNGRHNRTFMGKNLMSDFFCGRFDADEGFVEELIAVDEQPD